MTTERELAHQLRWACRRLTRYSGVDIQQSALAFVEIQNILSEWQYLEDQDELDTE